MSFGVYLKYRKKELFSGSEESIYDLLSKKFSQSIQKGQILSDGEVLIHATSLEDAFEIASGQLNCDVSQLSYRVIETGTRGFMGMGGTPYKVALRRELKGGEDLLSGDVHEADEFGTSQMYEANQDGYSELDVNRKGVFLVIHTPKGNGIKADKHDIRQLLIERGVSEKVEERIIDGLLKQRNPKPFYIEEWNPDPVKDGKVFVDISADRMNVCVRIIGPKSIGRYIDFDDVKNVLHENRVIEGINDENIHTALKNKSFNTLVHVAQGQAPVHGADAYIDYKVEIKDKVNFEELSDQDQIDWREMNLIANVMVDEVLAEKIPAQVGVDGMDVLGSRVEARNGRDISLEGGENTVVVDEGRLLKATVNGHAIKENGLISIMPVYIVSGDVGPETGNITNMGSVEIQGSILDGYSVKAAGNIEVKKSVGASQIEATGDVIIKLGVSGKGKGKIISKNGNCYARFIQDCEVVTEGSVVVNESMMHCHVKANDSVTLAGKKAVIVGGIIRALNEISAKTFGSTANVQTDLEVGVSPEVRESIGISEKRLEEIGPKLSSLNLDISTLEKQQLDEEKEEKLNKMREEVELLANEQKERHDELLKLQEIVENSSIDGKITAFKKVYSSVNLKCNMGILENKRDQGPSYYKMDPDKHEYIKLYPIKPTKGRRRM